MHHGKTELWEVCGVGSPRQMPEPLLSHFTILMEGENTPESAMVWKEKVILIIKLLFLWSHNLQVLNTYVIVVKNQDEIP